MVTKFTKKYNKKNKKYNKNHNNHNKHRKNTKKHMKGGFNIPYDNSGGTNNDETYYTYFDINQCNNVDFISLDKWNSDRSRFTCSKSSHFNRIYLDVLDRKTGIVNTFECTNSIESENNNFNVLILYDIENDEIYSFSHYGVILDPNRIINNKKSLKDILSVCKRLANSSQYNKGHIFTESLFQIFGIIIYVLLESMDEIDNWYTKTPTPLYSFNNISNMGFLQNLVIDVHKDRFEFLILDDNKIQLTDKLYSRIYYVSRNNTENEKIYFFCFYDPHNHKFYFFGSTGENIEYKDIKDIVDNLLEAVKSVLKHTPIDLKEMDLFQNIISLNILTPYLGLINFDNKDVRDKLSSINQELKKKCSGLEVMLNKFSKLHGVVKKFRRSYDDPNDLILCLYKENNKTENNKKEKKCVSSITLHQDGYDISIDSFTESSEEKKKYNQLLRSILIIISQYFKNESPFKRDVPKKFSTRIHSLAVNVISAWILISSYQTLVLTHREKHDFSDYISGIIQQSKDNPTNGVININDQLDFKIIKINEQEVDELQNRGYYKIINYFYANERGDSLDIYLDITDENIQKAEKIFKMLVGSSAAGGSGKEISCE
jgi:hypothetical protein